MIGRVKQWLGIEGVKLELVLPEEVSLGTGSVTGRLRFQSMHTQSVTWIRIVLLERYSRGRGAERLVDEYKLGEIEVEKVIEIPHGRVVEVPFVLSFTRKESKVDQLESNVLLRTLAKAAKLAHNVQSEFRIEAEAKVKGTALNPFAKMRLTMRR